MFGTLVVPLAAILLAAWTNDTPDRLGRLLVAVETLKGFRTGSLVGAVETHSAGASCQTGP
jgi:hypothetical protein